MAVRELGADRILYGSDVSGRSFSSQLAKVHGADISDEFQKSALRAAGVRIALDDSWKDVLGALAEVDAVD